MKSKSNQTSAEELFLKADRCWDLGRLSEAHRLFLSAAHLGDVSSQVNVGVFYLDGIGTRKDHSKALYWLKRAYSKGDASAATNIGILWKDEGKQGRALDWLKKAAALGDESSYLDSAKIYIAKGDYRRALVAAEKASRSNQVSMNTKKQATKLAREIKARSKKT